MADVANGMQRKGRTLLGFSIPEYPADDRTFMEKWREHVKQKKKSGDGVKFSQRMMRCLMLFQAPTQLYIFMRYIVPYTFSDYDPWVLYYMKVFCCFLMINGLANWFCVILYDPSVPKSRDRPDLVKVDNHWDNPPDQFVPLIQEATSQQNGSVVYDMTAKEALPWEFCQKCNMHIPPRAHHCKHCKTCILKRDHHCFMVGNCIGFKNQRFFIVLAFYSMLIGTLGCYFQYKYIREVYWPMTSSWTDLVPPIALYRCIFGSTPGYICLMVVHVYLEFLFGLIGWVYFTSQMAISMEGKTLYEVAKKVPIKNNNSVGRNLRSVFGDFWALNFLFPMIVVLRQRDDGVHWEGVKVSHSGDDKKSDGDAEIL